MAASVQDLKNWFEIGLQDPEVTHMVVKCDEFDYEDYPVYVRGGEAEARRIRESGERTMEVYKMSLGWEAQGIGGKRVFNY